MYNNLWQRVLRIERSFSKHNISQFIASVRNIVYKLSKANPKIFDEEKNRQILQSAALLQKLRNSNIELIYLDEFTFNPIKIKF